MDERLATLRKAIASDRRKLATSETEHVDIEQSINTIQSELESMRDQLKSLEEDEIAKGQAVNTVKKSSGTSSTGFQKSLKEIGGWVCFAKAVE